MNDKNDDQAGNGRHKSAFTRPEYDVQDEVMRLDKQALDETVRNLWRRRPELNQVEWTVLYLIVARVLRRGYFAQLQTLPESRDWYIQNFFIDKVFRFDNPGEIFNAGALYTFFRNYLLSQWRALGPNSPHTDEVGADGQTDVDEQGGKVVDSSNDGIDDRNLVDEIAERVENWLNGGDYPVTLSRDIKQDFGIDLPLVMDSARRFLAGMDEWAGLQMHSWWIRIYLREHQCPDNGVALYLLARRYQIPAQHHRAVNLGVTVPGGDHQALAAFANSYRGQWLRSLGIAVDSSHQLEMMLALKILCILALRE